MSAPTLKMLKGIVSRLHKAGLPFKAIDKVVFNEDTNGYKSWRIFNKKG